MDKKKKKKTSFSGDNYAGQVQSYVNIVKGLKSKHWKAITEDLGQYYAAIKRKRAGRDEDVSDASTGDEGMEYSDVVQASQLADLDEDPDLDD